MEKLKELKLSDIVELKHGHQFRSDDLIDNGEIPVIKIGQIGDNGTLNMKDLTYISNDRIEEFKDYIIKNGDILISLTGNLGRIVVVENLNGIALQNYRVGKLEVKPGFDKIFIKNLLDTQYVRKQIERNSNQTAQANFGKKDLDKIKVLIPDASIQAKIGNTLELIDKQKIELEKQMQNYIELKKGLMQQLLAGEF